MNQISFDKIATGKNGYTANKGIENTCDMNMIICEECNMKYQMTKELS